MQDPHGITQQIQSAGAAIIVIAVALAVFWRVALRVLVAIVAIMVAAVVGSLAVGLLYAVHG